MVLYVGCEGDIGTNQRIYLRSSDWTVTQGGGDFTGGDPTQTPFVNNVVTSSIASGTSSVLSSMIETATYDGSSGEDMTRKEFIMYRVDGNIPLTAFYVENQNQISETRYNFDIMRMSNPVSLIEFEEALTTSNSFVNGSQFITYSNTQTGRTGQDIIDLFDDKIAEVRDLQTGFSFDVATTNVTQT